ncbi:MAG: periplasmic heavy metal sensor [Acidobacteria bacterium]|nr:periplasmic heavy metal sensor [Acidobacteriota bacterium]
MRGSRLLPILLGAALSSAALAQTASPYVGEQERAIKALSPERQEGLLAGAGLGYAKAAELNGHPGPKHVLEFAQALGLTPEQRHAVEESFDRMRVAAQALGAGLVAAEEQLDRRFAHRHLDAEKLSELTTRIGELEGRLRYVHLVAHLETDALLTAEQRARYAELRGYASGMGSVDRGHSGHEGH